MLNRDFLLYSVNLDLLDTVKNKSIKLPIIKNKIIILIKLNNIKIIILH